MSSLGRMAAGVAHEINSPLSGVMVYSHLLLEELSEPDARRVTLQKVIHEAERCQQIIRGMLEFARTNPGQKQPVDLNETLRATVNLLKDQGLFREVTLRLELAPGLASIEGEQGQLQQAFSNLILNAVQAMNGRGRLTLTSQFAPPDRLAVSVRDTGCGILPENLGRVFEPFFSTKHDQGGTGLGLAITHSIVERHGGKLEVQSEVRKGTTVCVTFPVTQAGWQA
jgi:signal transduction histidine kinase